MSATKAPAEPSIDRIEEITRAVVEIAHRTLVEATAARALGCMTDAQEKWICDLARVPYDAIVPGTVRLYAPGRVEVQLKGEVRKIEVRGVVSV